METSLIVKMHYATFIILTCFVEVEKSF